METLQTGKPETIALSHVSDAVQALKESLLAGLGELARRVYAG